MQTFDDPFEGRSVVVGLGRGPQGSASNTQQLFQIDRQAELVNQLAGTTFSGLVSLVSDTNKELSYACSSRSPASTTPASSCPDISDQPCDAGCNAGRGQLYAPERDCKLADSRVITCNAPSSQTFDLACSVRSDGLVVLGSGSLQQVSGFTACDAATSQRAMNAPLCP